MLPGFILNEILERERKKQNPELSQGELRIELPLPIPSRQYELDDLDGRGDAERGIYEIQITQSLMELSPVVYILNNQ